MRPRLFALVSILIASGCTRAPSPTASAGPDSGGGGTKPDEHGMPEPIRVDVIAKLCAAATCSGKQARVEVWRTAEGKVARYVHHGDITSCSHAPTTVFDATGTQVGLIANKAIVPGSDEDKKFTELKKSLLGDSRHVETADCTGRVTPR